MPYFHTNQAIHDLMHHAKTAAPETLATLAKGDPTRLFDMIHAMDSHVAMETDLAPHLLEAAASPEDRACFVTAIEILLAERLQDGRWSDDLSWHWTGYHQIYATLPPTARAAIHHGFSRLEKLGKLTLDPPLQPQYLLTSTKVSIQADLLAIARSASDDILRDIAEADHGENIDQHFAALKRVIHNQAGIMLPDDHWYPDEVVSLCSHTPSDEFPYATAIILITALETADAEGGAEFRWQGNALAYRKLPIETGRPILSAFRHLYETVEFWNDDPSIYKMRRRMRVPFFHLIPVLDDTYQPSPAR